MVWDIVLRIMGDERRGEGEVEREREMNEEEMRRILPSTSHPKHVNAALTCSRTLSLDPSSCLPAKSCIAEKWTSHISYRGTSSADRRYVSSSCFIRFNFFFRLIPGVENSVRSLRRCCFFRDGVVRSSLQMRQSHSKPQLARRVLFEVFEFALVDE